MSSSRQSPPKPQSPKPSRLKVAPPPAPPAMRQSPPKPQSPKPSSRQSPQPAPQPARGQSLQTSPPKHSMPEDISLKIFNLLLDSATELNNEFIMLLMKISTINKVFKIKEASLKNIDTIDLQNLTITKEIVDILKMTDSQKIQIIMLRNIKFDNEGTLKSFLMFLNKNTILFKLVLNNIEHVKILLENLLEKKGAYNELRILAIMNNNLDGSDVSNLIKILINFKYRLSNYLTFTYNTLDKKKSLDLLRFDSINVFDGFDIKIQDNNTVIKIIKLGEGESPERKYININIAVNYVANYVDDGKYIKFGLLKPYLLKGIYDIGHRYKKNDRYWKDKFI